MNIATATPAQIDTEIARLHGELDSLDTHIARVASDLHRANEDRRVQLTRTQATWEKPLEDTVVELRAKLLAGQIESYNEHGVRRSLQALEVAQTTQEALKDLLRPLTAEFTSRGGWTRAFLCTNDNGHVHASQACSTLRISTSLNWVITVEVDGQDVEVSGMTEQQIVDLAGESACTVCYTSAPVDPSRKSQIQAPEKVAARREREAAAAIRKAKAAKAGIVDPETGAELRIHSTFRGTEVVKTERAAAIALVDALWYQKHYGNDEKRAENIETLLAALAHKHDTTVEVERVAADKRLVAREKRDARG